MVLITASALALALAQRDTAPVADDLRQAAYNHAYSRRGSSNAQFVCQNVGKILSITKIGRHRYSARYDEVVYYNDQKPPRLDMRIVVEKVGDHWVWVTGDEPTCKNMVL